MSKKLLLADDSITIQKVIGITFANEDYELCVVDNGDAAFEKARHERPDLILADVFMPGKNGYELCAAVRQDPSLHSIPVLLLTGTFEPFDENKARSVGADSWIAKPFESQALIDRVERLLAKVQQPSPVAPEPPMSAAAPPAAPVAQVIPTSSAVAAPDADIWGDLAEADAAEADAAAPAASPAEGFTAVSAEMSESGESPAPEEDIWGDVSFDEADLLGSEVSDLSADDIWGEEETAELLGEVPPTVFAEEAFIFEEEPQAGEALPPAAPAAPAIEEFIFEEDEESFSPTSPAGLEELEEEILPLEELDILAEEDLDALAAAPVEQAFFLADAAVPSAADAATAPTEPGGVPTFAAETESLEQPFAVEEEFTLTEEGPEWGMAEEPGIGIVPSAPVAEEFVVTPVQAAGVPEFAAPPLSAAAVEERMRGLSEEELAQIVDRVAGSVIERLAASVLERIAWEVVPDLAESLVREEIRKIREGAQ